MLYFIHHDTQTVRIAGVTAKPTTDRVVQQAHEESVTQALEAFDIA